MSRVAARTSVSSRGSIAVSGGATLIFFEDRGSKSLAQERTSFQRQPRQIMNGARLSLPSEVVVADLRG